MCTIMSQLHLRPHSEFVYWSFRESASSWLCLCREKNLQKIWSQTSWQNHKKQVLCTIVPMDCHGLGLMIGWLVAEEQQVGNVLLAHSVRSIPEKPWLYLAVWFFSRFQSDSSGNSRYSNGPWSLVIKHKFCLAGCPSKIILEQWLNNKQYSSHWITAETWCEESLC